MDGKEYCMYLRKSRADMDAEAHGAGETLARHEKALFELAKRQQLNITQIHKEIVSGNTIAARPVMQQLLQEVQAGQWAGVLVMEVERLARGETIDQGIISMFYAKLLLLFAKKLILVTASVSRKNALLLLSILTASSISFLLNLKCCCPVLNSPRLDIFV